MDTHAAPEIQTEITLDLINALLDDWHKPGMSELGLCRAHQISLETLEHAAEHPKFQAALERIDRIRAKRRPAIAAAIHADTLDRLLHIAHHNPTSANFAKEIRLALKLLNTLFPQSPPS
ncbi:MAG: hypothetical protein D6692_02525, partial [Planctomycetota bacterium]